MTPPDRFAASKRSRVLLVEADPGDAELVQLWLRSARQSQYDLWHVESLGDAEGCLAKADFELAMVDLSLPDAAGPWAYHALRERHPELPILVFSSYAEAEVGERLLAEGAQDHLVKGQMSGDSLIRSMRHGVEIGRLMAELRLAREQSAGATPSAAARRIDVAREFQTPLQTILGMADLLLETDLTREQTGYVHSCMRASEGLLGRVDALFEGGLPEVSAPAREEAAAAMPLGLDPDLRVLVVDDSRDARERLATQLRGASISAETVADGEAAVELCQGGEFDLVLMDVQMPGMGGIAATRAIRSLEGEAGREPVPILAVTGLTATEDIRACLEAGYDDHLPKPVETEVLLAAVARHAPKRQGRLLRVDGGSVEEIDLYLHERHNDLAGLRFALEAEDFDSVRAVAIELESSGVSRGFEELAGLGRRLQAATDRNDRGEVERGIADLGDFLREVKIIVG